MKKNLSGILILIGILTANIAMAAVLQGFQGGTGISSTISGNVGNFLTVASTSPFLTYTFASSTGGSGLTSSTPQYFGGLAFFDTSSTLKSSLDMLYNPTTGVLTIGTSTITTLSSSNVSSTNISVSGYGLFPTLNFTNASGTNITASGYGVFPTLKFTNASGTSASFSNFINIATGTISSVLQFSNYSSLPQIEGPDTTSGIHFDGPGIITIHNSGNQTMTFSSTNKVGIGTSAPVATFEVHGTSSAATAPQFITASSSGAITFQILANGTASSSQLRSASTTFPNLLNVNLATDGQGHVVATTTGAGSGTSLTISLTAGMSLATGTPVYVESGNSGVVDEITKNGAASTTAAFLAGTPQDNNDAESFATPFNATSGETISRVVWTIWKSGTPTGNLIAQLRPDNAGVPSSTVLTSGTTDAASLSGVSSATTTPFSSPYIFPTSGKYWFVATSTVSNSGTNFLNWAYATTCASPNGTSAKFTNTGGGTWADTFAGANGCLNIDLEATRIVGNVYPASANATSTSLGYVGFPTAVDGVGSLVTIQTDGTLTGLNGLSTGLLYYISNTTGTISTATGTITQKAGLAVSSSSLLLIH